ncbi:hypothetical protein [Cellulomonas alba]|uniref:DNA-binding protein n=1 Tax=Cellulomonas alba TaxID=3053467 RepID=A0ABT7SCV7_9CELL|nr:hypothetical protein [Cellulomonas alba]MDM7853397.1 hypothetical protein [Cellulomonas alba]
MFVVTMDQQGSRTRGDHVDALLAELGPSPDALRAFTRTVGDEVQGVYAQPRAALQVVLRVLRLGGWSVGVGAGAVDEPLPADARAASGAAFVHAREAVEAAKSRQRSVPLVVRGDDEQAAADAEAVVVLIAATAARRSSAGWAAIDALTAAGASARQDEVARTLGISQQAVSQRLRTAMWAEEVAARGAAERLLAAAEGAARPARSPSS